MNLTIQIKEFIKKLNQNAPLFHKKQLNENEDIHEFKYKYPYKPALILSVFYNIKDVNKLFNNWIKINDNKIIKTYYNIIVNCPTMFDFLHYHKHKQHWNLIYNDELKKEIIRNIFENPAKHLIVKDFFEIDLKNKAIKINERNCDLEQLRKYIIQEAYNTLINCIEDYKNLSVDEIVDYDEFMTNELIVADKKYYSYKSKIRAYQHLFRKEILNRDKRCKICCLKLEDLLDACHIKPDSDCINAIEQNDINNGITLCKNHHRLFDEGYFSFENNWKVIISDKFNKKDIDFDLLIKRYEPCYHQELELMPNNNEYIKYHRENVFIK